MSLLFVLTHVGGVHCQEILVSTIMLVFQKKIVVPIDIRTDERVMMQVDIEVMIEESEERLPSEEQVDALITVCRRNTIENWMNLLTLLSKFKADLFEGWSANVCNELLFRLWPLPFLRDLFPRERRRMWRKIWKNHWRHWISRKRLSIWKNDLWSLVSILICSIVI